MGLLAQDLLWGRLNNMDVCDGKEDTGGSGWVNVKQAKFPVEAPFFHSVALTWRHPIPVPITHCSSPSSLYNLSRRIYRSFNAVPVAYCSGFTS